MSPLSAVFFHGKITPFCPINRKFATAAPSEKAGLVAAVCTSVVLHLRWRKVFGVWRPPFYHVAFIFKVELLPFFLKALKEYGAEIEHFFNTLIFRSINFCVIWKRKTINLIILESWTFDAFLQLFNFIKIKDWVPFLKLPTLISRKIYEAENSLISTQRSGSSVTTHCFSLIRRVWCSLGQPPLLQQVHFL